MDTKNQPEEPVVPDSQSNNEVARISTDLENPVSSSALLTAPGKEISQFAGYLKNFPQDIEKAKESVDKVKLHIDSLKEEIRKMEESIKPSKRFNQDKALGISEAKLTPPEKLVRKVQLSRLRIELSYAVPVYEILYAKLKNLVAITNSSLKLKRLRIKSESPVYMRKNLKNIKKRTARVLNEAIINKDLKETITDLRESAKNPSQFNSTLTTFLRNVSEETYILTSGLPRYQSEVYDSARQGFLNWKRGKAVDFEEFLLEEK